MLLDSGNIISDETFYKQSQIIVEKVRKFSAESLCLHQGMVTSGRWCHNWDSNHPLAHKRSVIRTLLGRADQVVSEEQDKQEEEEHVQKC